MVKIIGGSDERWLLRYGGIGEEEGGRRKE